MDFFIILNYILLNKTRVTGGCIQLWGKVKACLHLLPVYLSSLLSASFNPVLREGDGSVHFKELTQFLMRDSEELTSSFSC